MKRAWGCKSLRVSTGAIYLLLAGAGLSAVVVTFSLLVPIHDTRSESDTARVPAAAAPSTLISEATAGTPMRLPDRVPAERGTAGEHNPYDYQLERDSCCIGN
jgi:hypothetical protein